MSNWEKVLHRDDLNKARLQRRKSYINKRIRKDEQEDGEKKGLKYIKTFKNGDIQMREEKPIGDQFENRVWTMFYNMGFTFLNEDNKFVISYDANNPNLTKQIDVFALDDETVLVIECKAASTPHQTCTFKTEIESMNGYMKGIRNSIRKQYGNRNVKFIWATHNYDLGEIDQQRLLSFEITHFDDDKIEYYENLSKHLGSAAKYQLLATLFKGKKISNMDNTVPAVQGQMGTHTYYSFSIEPERLLKIGYVLHRSDSNKDMMPTYQRIIKKGRLKKVREFVNNGGYFPNSIVISISTGKKRLQFDIKSGIDKNISKLGILHLPKKYHTAYIIDGQHRLYGYSNSKYASTNTIPVVAFENLEQEEQIKLFMEINENQKAVSKNLRNTLNADLLWNSDDFNERRKALRLDTAVKLGENPKSPLYERIIIGENTKTKTCCITMDNIEDGLSYGKLLTKFDQDNKCIAELGLLDNAEGDNKYAQSKLIPFLLGCFNYFKEQLPEEWEKGENDQGILTNNTGVNALIRIFSDVLFCISDKYNINPAQENIDCLINKCKNLFDCIIKFYRNIDADLRSDIKQQYGAGGVTKHWRYFQMSIHEEIPDFNPEGLEKWWRDNSKQYNESTLYMTNRIINKTKALVWNYINENDIRLPFKTHIKLNEKTEKNFRKNDIKSEPNNKDRWEFATLLDCEAVANDGSNWSNGLDKILTRPEERNIKKKKSDKMRWLREINTISKNLNTKSYSVTNEKYEYVNSIYAWFVNEHGLKPFID